MQDEKIESIKAMKLLKRMGLVVLVLAVGAILAGVSYLVCLNPGSRNLLSAAVGLFAAVIVWGLAFTKIDTRKLLSVIAVVGAVLVFGTNALSELRGSESSEGIGVAFLIDRGKPDIYQWPYESASFQRMGFERLANEWIAAHKPETFAAEREKLATDLALYSVVAYIWETQPDWQVELKN